MFGCLPCIHDNMAGTILLKFGTLCTDTSKTYIKDTFYPEIQFLWKNNAGRLLVQIYSKHGSHTAQPILSWPRVSS